MGLTLQEQQAIVRRLGINPALVSDDALSDLRRLCVTRVMPLAGRFGSWLHGWLDTEQARRQTTPDDAPLRHCMALPLDVHEWSDKEIGEGMVAATRLSVHCTGCPHLGRIIDRLCEVFAEHCHERLMGETDNG